MYYNWEVMALNNKNLIKYLYIANEIKFYACGNDERAIYTEIFENHSYKLDYDKDVIVIDIGMNVGLASLYFAGLSNVKKVYGFEPFKFTYDCALENLNLNPDLKDKIIPYNYGLGALDKSVEGCINMDYKGNSSTTRKPLEGDTLEIVKIKSTGDTVKKIIDENQDSKIVMKIDCEGGEGEIFKDKGFLDLINEDKIVEIIMETHTPELLELITNILESAGFKVHGEMISLSNGYIKGTKF